MIIIQKKAVKMTLLIVAGVIVLGIAVYAGMIIHWANITEMEMLSKTHFDFIVKDGQLVDCNDFVNPQGETRALDGIDKNVRLQISDYMRENNLKLREGLHHILKKSFRNGIEDIGTLEEHLKYFNFESID